MVLRKITIEKSYLNKMLSEFLLEVLVTFKLYVTSQKGCYNFNPLLMLSSLSFH